MIVSIEKLKNEQAGNRSNFVPLIFKDCIELGKFPGLHIEKFPSQIKLLKSSFFSGRQILLLSLFESALSIVPESTGQKVFKA